MWLIVYSSFNSEFNPDVIDILSTPENATQSKISVSQTEISEEDVHHEQPSIFNPFQKEILTYLVEGFKVSIVSKLIAWDMFIHTRGVGFYVSTYSWIIIKVRSWLKRILTPSKLCTEY